MVHILEVFLSNQRLVPEAQYPVRIFVTIDGIFVPSYCQEAMFLERERA
jgi:hypothetical protein